MSATSPSLSRFLLRTWIWHFTVTLIFFVMLIIVVRPRIAAMQATHLDLLIILACMLLCIVHTILVLIISMRRFSKREPRPGLVYLVHFFGSACLAYYSCWLFTGGVFQEIIPG